MPQIDVVENFADENILTQAQLHAAFLSIENFLNLTKLDAENIQAGSIDSTLLASESTSTDKIAPNAVLLSKLATEVINRLVPSGAVTAYGGDIIPSGYLLCDGSLASRTTFSALFGAIGTKHGVGDGSTTFNLPDYRGRFLRGKDSGTARDPDAASRTAMATGGSTGDSVGSVQLNDYPNHNHGTYQDNGSGAIDEMVSGGGQGATVTGVSTVPGGVFTSKWVRTTTEGGSSTEVRPINAGVNWIIKT